MRDVDCVSLAALGGIVPALRGGAMAIIVLLVAGLGCSSTIDHERVAPGDEPTSSATAGGPADAADMNELSTGHAGRGGAGSRSATPPQSPPTAGSDGAPEPSLSSPGAAGMGASTPVAGTGPMETEDPAECVEATRLWFEDFENGDHQRWTSNTYNENWGNDCQSTALSKETAVSPGNSQRSEIRCAYAADTVHRGYGGLQFAGDQRVPAFTNQGVGIDAPDGVVNTMWVRLESPTVFENGKWLSLWTVNGACSWDVPDEVLTLGIEDASGRLAAAHYQSGGGTRTFEPGATAMPRGEWVRITVYVNYHSGEMHVWQNGKSSQHVTFKRSGKTICHWHWGLYASSNNDDVVLFEDDKSLWKLHEPWDDFSVEPYFDATVRTCE
jgi:hypothetical protein